MSYNNSGGDAGAGCLLGILIGIGATILFLNMRPLRYQPTVAWELYQESVRDEHLRHEEALKGGKQ